MSGPNHIAGGLVFTGILASFWNINIFASPAYIAFTAFFSVLPDIDHTKSPIGKLFYPLAKFLDRKFGHRTITHSLIVYISLLLIISFICTVYLKDNTITLIFAFSYISHLIFDMMTKQGVPLFYPFARNACVIPGNPEYRLKSSDFRTETACFVVFVLLGISCKPLFAQGFWTTYNHQFNTLKHVHSEFKNTPNLLGLEYLYSYQGQTKTGNGFVIECSNTKAIVFVPKTGFEEIKGEYKISILNPKKTLIPFKKEELFFFSIKPDSLEKLVHNKALVNLKVQSTLPINFLKDKKPTTSKSIDLEYIYNPSFTFGSDSASIELRHRIELLNYELQQEQTIRSVFESGRRAIHDSITQLTLSIPKMDLYHREKATESIIKLKSKLSALTKPSDNSEKILLQLRQLNDKLKNSNVATCSGYIAFIKL